MDIIEEMARAATKYAVSSLCVDSQPGFRKWIYVVWDGEGLRRDKAVFESDSEIEARKKCAELNMRAALSAALERGWKLVPVQPTPEMLKADDFEDDPAFVWRAMISAAPAIQSSPKVGV